MELRNLSFDDLVLYEAIYCDPEMWRDLGEPRPREGWRRSSGVAWRRPRPRRPGYGGCAEVRERLRLDRDLVRFGRA
jgi:hypothetical protein